MFNTEVEFKSVVSSLRKGLRKHYGSSAPSHSQLLELMATALGATSYAHLRTGWSDASEAPTTPKAGTVSVSAEPAPKQNEDERLRNDKGQFDLVGEQDDDNEEEEGGVVVLGRDFSSVNGTLEDIIACVAGASRGYRANGELVPHYEGETDVNWDGQETQRNERGESLWESDAYSEIPSSELILVPEGFDPELDPDEDGNWPWLVREKLLDAYVSYAQRHNLVQALVLGQEAFPDLDDETLERVADALGFALHYGEVERLIERLKEL